MDALSAAMHLHLLMSYCDRIEVACMAQGVNVIHSLLNINTSGVMVKTPTFYVFKMFIPHHINGAKWVPITASNIQTTTQNTQNSGNQTMPVLTLGATVDNSQYVNISFSNIDISYTRQITVTLTSDQSSYTVESAQVITGSAINSYNNFGTDESVNIQTLASSDYSMDTKTLTATLPSKSIVMFGLAPHSTVVKPGSFLKNSADSFSIKSGPRGTVIITSSVRRSTPVNITLYSVDGRTLVESFTGTREPGNKSIIRRPKNPNMGTNVYIIRMKTGEVTKSQRIVFKR